MAADVTDFGIRIEHVGIHVPDMDASMQWYQDVFGFERVPPPAKSFPQGPFPRMSRITLGDFDLEVYEVQEAKPYSLVDYEFKHGLKHLSFAIKDMHGWLAYIKSRGDITIAVENHFGSTGVVVYLRDNIGMLVEATWDYKKTTEEERAFYATRDPLAVKNAREFGVRIQHAGIHVANMEETFQWYHDVLGFEKCNRPGGTHGAGVFPYCRDTQLGDFQLEVYEVQEAEPFNFTDFEFTCGVKHLNFEIKDRKGWLEYIKARGDIEIVVENNFKRENGFAGSVYMRDNTGMLVEISGVG